MTDKVGESFAAWRDYLDSLPRWKRWLVLLRYSL